MKMMIEVHGTAKDNGLKQALDAADGMLCVRFAVGTCGQP